jgi:DNA-binding transcriptional LysR family regulator
LDILKGMTIFVEVAKQQGFAPAARELNLSTSAVSRYVIDLEDWLGLQLFQRTTRKLSLTDAGKTYLDRCQQVVTEVHDIKHAASDLQAEPQGLLRITAPNFISKNFLHDLLPGYLNRNPKIELELVLSDHFIDLVEGGFDLAIRAGELKDSTLVVRKLMDVELVLVAAPTYLEQHGQPKTVADLKAHNCLIDTATSYNNHWPVADKKNGKPVVVHGDVRVNSGEIIRSLALAGMGIAFMPKFFFARDIYEGKLISFFDSKIQFSGGIFAAYPQRKHMSANVRSFIDYLVGYIDQLELLYRKQ